MLKTKLGFSFLILLALSSCGHRAPKESREDEIIEIRDKKMTDSFRATLKAIFPDIRLCYEERLKVDPGLMGKLTIHIELDHRGFVESSSIRHSFDDMLDACILKSVQLMVFKKFKTEGIPVIDYPIAFDPLMESKIYVSKPTH